MNEIYLSKEEIPVTKINSFFMPVHPRLLEIDSIDRLIARDAFLRACDEWWTEISPEKEKYRYIPSSKPKIRDEGVPQFLGWEGWTEHLDNGFVYCFSIAREDGSMFYNRDDLNCTRPFPMGKKIDGYKLKGFAQSDGNVHAYSFHNLNSYPAALLLRDWSINYMNEVFRRYINNKVNVINNKVISKKFK